MAQVIEADELQSVFDGIADQYKAIDYGDTIKGFVSDLQQQHSKQFQSGTDSDGNSWAPLKESTIKRKGHGVILIETEQLMNSLTQGGAKGSITEFGGRNGSVVGSLMFGTDDRTAGFHQSGTSRMPARPPVGVSEETLTKMTNDIADATVEGMKE